MASGRIFPINAAQRGAAFTKGPDAGGSWEARVIDCEVFASQLPAEAVPGLVSDAGRWRAGRPWLFLAQDPGQWGAGVASIEWTIDHSGPLGALLAAQD